MKKKLKDLLDYEQPTKYIVKTENYSDEYKLPVLTAGKSFVLGYTNETEGVFRGKNEPVIIFDDFTRDTKYVDFDFKVKSSAMKILHKHNKDDSLKYLHYALNNIKYVPFSHKRLWISDFSNMEIDYPSPEIQNTIATELDTIQSAIDNKKQQLALLDEAVKSEFVEMFGNPVTNEKGWESKRLDLCCDGIGDGLHGTPEYVDESNFPFINGNNLENNIIITSGTKFVSKETYEKHYISLTENTLLLSINGTLGKLAYYKGETVMLGKSACYIILKKEINKRFVFGLMSSDSFLDFMEHASTKSTIKNVGLKAIRDYKLILPPLDLQNKFAAFVQQIDKSKFIVKQQIADLQELLDSKMQEYFS